ncbi:hypothetical protein [Allokutzneria albata]|uniref:Uncharacterized protein n=1 Tax=Allokutzneria albata TaxID=211114 RepID=A0A1G9SC04_ALLAB|nr:hypothetical protein [Allokutzneria albata]SDM32850.1 hypothetical protein SAMN04489726_1047 [Allokutzneria albata]
MSSRSRIALIVGAGIAVATTVVLLRNDPKPELDEDLVREVTPAVHSALLTNGKLTWPTKSGGRWFCATRAVETRRDGDMVRVGVLATCMDYTRVERCLASSAGSSGAVVVTLRGNQVLNVEVPVDGAGNDAMLRRMFSEAGYAEVRRSVGRESPDPAPKAKAAFGLPADAPSCRIQQ